MGKLLEFKRKEEREADANAALEGNDNGADQAVKHIASLFTKEELAEIRKELEETETNKHHGG